MIRLISPKNNNKIDRDKILEISKHKHKYKILWKTTTTTNKPVHHEHCSIVSERLWDELYFVEKLEEKTPLLSLLGVI